MRIGKLITLFDIAFTVHEIPKQQTQETSQKMETHYPWHRYRVASEIVRLTPEEKKHLRGLKNYLDVMQMIHDIKQRRGQKEELLPVIKSLE